VSTSVTATEQRPGTAQPLSALGQGGLIALLLAVAVIGWVVTDERMAGMDAGPGTDPGAVGFYVTAWVMMMAAMMFPSIAPMVLLYARMQRGRRERGAHPAIGGTAGFLAGYLVTWTAAGLLGFVLIKAGRALEIRALSWSEAGSYVAGGVIIAAAIYQLTPLKNVCLRKCRDPFTFVLTSWRPGRTGALRMGLAHGAWCVGCCWALMAALFALGVMSIGWMAFIAAVIAFEKLLPCKTPANRGIAVTLLVLGLAVALAPERVPGLTLPDSAQARDAMTHMDGPAMKMPDRRNTDGAPMTSRAAVDDRAHMPHGDP
jgi:predicted metal-binding membrane protein